MGMFDMFRKKPSGKPVINQAIQDRNSALNEIYAMQNNNPAAQFPNLTGGKKKVKK